MQKYILGIDEVGRGSLAGPVMLAGVLLSSSFPLETFAFGGVDYTDYEDLKFVKDSKKLTEIQRNQATHLIQKYCLPKLVVDRSNHNIDDIGIGVCLSEMLIEIIEWAIKTIGKDLKVIVDGKIKLLKSFDVEVIRENKADDRYLAVALASSAAKVKRDDLMVSLHNKFPKYGWNRNKGYGTLFHRNAIKKHPENEYLRKTFLSRVLR